MQCEYCGRALKPGDWQCPGCGAPVEQHKEEKQEKQEKQKPQEESREKRDYTEEQNSRVNESKNDRVYRSSHLGAVLNRCDYGGFVRRCTAEWIDWIVVAIISAMVGVGEGSVLVYCIYQVIGASWIFRGATIGKKAMNIRVVGLNYEAITLRQSLVRLVCKFLSMCTLCIGFCMIIFTNKRQGLHDRLCETCVIRIRK